MVLIVFALGLVSGAFLNRAGNLFLSALIGGVLMTTVFVLLSSIPAFIATLVQSVRDFGAESFSHRFLRYLNVTMEVLIQGWS